MKKILAMLSALITGGLGMAVVGSVPEQTVHAAFYMN